MNGLYAANCHRWPCAIARPPFRPSPDNKADPELKQTLSLALERRGYTSLTPVQEAVTDPDLGTGDLLVSAQTGSGKTVGFGLAIADTVLGEDDRFAAAAAPLALVIAPTRELALQVKRELAWLYGEAGAVVASCVGGMDMRDERRALDRGAHLVVATPGRLRDHIMRGSIDLSDLRAVVLDEADEMLDLGFREDLEFILGEAPEERQTLLFSATVPPAIEHLARSYQRDAKRISTVAETSQHSDIDYQAMLVSQRDGDNAIINVLRFYEAPNAIVFCNTRAMVNRLLSRLSNRGFAVVALSGELSQAERSHALQAMRDGRARVCVATDVAARGIDLPNLELVIHAELPSSHETLLHRSGRTGRAGRKGVSALVVSPKSRKKAERLLKMAKLHANWGGAPSAEAVRSKDTERMLNDPSWTEDQSSGEEEMIAQLTQPSPRATGRWLPAPVECQPLGARRALRSG
ncbi:DEAD/DEAH box helicase-like protein [Roseobacter sp. SK209-2-6]|nr:DEAD/DEAH box helicase-like protein [Roseobacter sp. SK209-2-6]